MNRAAFYAALRANPILFGRGLSQLQDGGIDASSSRRTGAHESGWLAYMLATPFLETGATMQPLKKNLNYLSKWWSLPLIYSVESCQNSKETDALCSNSIRIRRADHHFDRRAQDRDVTKEPGESGTHLKSGIHRVPGRIRRDRHQLSSGPHLPSYNGETIPICWLLSMRRPGQS